MSKRNEGHEREGNKQGLTIALMITIFIMVTEFIGGFLSRSLALLSDAGHMLSDATSLGLTLFAIWFASRPATKEKTFGYYRMEILAALFNAAVLFVASGIIIYHAIDRIFHPVAVNVPIMMIIAAIGLIANITSAISLFKKGDVDSNLNLKSAYLHVISDAFTSFGVIVSGVLIMAFGWHLADPIMSIITTLIILKGAWGVLNDSIHILMQGTPEGIDPEEIKYELEKLDGVKDVHDLHVWTISSGFDSISCHILIEDDHDTENILQQSIDKIEKAFGIRHITIQLEKYDYSTI